MKRRASAFLLAVTSGRKQSKLIGTAEMRIEIEGWVVRNAGEVVTASQPAAARATSSGLRKSP